MVESLEPVVDINILIVTLGLFFVGSTYGNRWRLFGMAMD